MIDELWSKEWKGRTVKEMSGSLVKMHGEEGHWHGSGTVQSGPGEGKSESEV